MYVQHQAGMRMDHSAMMARARGEMDYGTAAPPRVGASAAAAVRPVAPNTPQGNRPGDGTLANLLKRATGNYQSEMKARYEKLMGMAQQFGAAQTAQSQQMMMQQQAQGQASLVSRGLGNSTVVDAVNQQAGDLHQRRLLDINERSNAIQMGVVEGHQPQAPDLGMYANLFAAPRTGGPPLTSSLPMLQMFSQPQAAAPAAPAPARRRRAA